MRRSPRASGSAGDVVLKSTLAAVRERPDQVHVWRNISDAHDMQESWESLSRLVDPAVGRFVVQRNAPTGVPIAVRTFEDPLFGPVVSFASPGPVIEFAGRLVLPHSAPGRHEVSAMVREVKSSPLLFGYRGADPVDVAAVEDLIARVAALQNDLPQLSSLELSLVLAGRGRRPGAHCRRPGGAVRDPRPDSFVRRMTDLVTTIPE